MDNQQTSGLIKDKFTWTIKNFSKLNIKKLYSEKFIVAGYAWRILIFPKGNNVDYLSIYLDVADSSRLPVGWSRNATFSLAVINQDGKKTVKKDAEHQFTSRASDWGFTSFVPLGELYDLGKGYLANDTCVIEAEFSSPKSGNENQGNQAADKASQKSGDQAGPMEVETPKKVDRCRDAPIVPPLSAQVSAQPIQNNGNSSLTTEVSPNPIGELVDFKGLGKIEKVFVPLLEEVCTKYPSLIECQQKRSCRFIEWAFTALGRVLHFLKNKKVKDMNDEACCHLQILWEELETFKFDLTWLEPHVQSALGMKNYVERAKRVNKLRGNVDAFEMEMKRLKVKLAAAELDLEAARGELVQAEQGFEEMDVDAELGYGRP